MRAGQSGAFDSRRVAAPVQVDLWEKATARFLVPMRIRAAGRSIAGVISARQVGGTSFCRLSATPHTAVRDGDLVPGPGAGHYKVAIGLHGRSTVTQHGRRVSLRPGDVTVYDTSEGYGVLGDVPFGLLVALVPQDALDLTRDRVAAVSATRLDGELASVARSRLLALAAGQGDAAAVEQAMAAVGRLVRAAPPVRLPGRRDGAELLARAKEVLAARLEDPSLTPDHLAALLGVSRRSLYDLFAADVGPVARYVRTLRLERARDLLLAPGSRSVADVAVACGLPDAAHFSRLFRREYGVPPVRYRRDAAPGG